MIYKRKGIGKLKVLDRMVFSCKILLNQKEEDYYDK